MAASIKALHLAAGNLYGGVESQMVTTARFAGTAPGLAHEFALCFEGRLSEELRSAGAAVHRLPGVRYSRPWTILAARRGLRRLVAAAGTGVVVTHGCWPHSLFAPVARRAGKPVAFWMHDLVKGTHWIDRLARRTVPDLVLANSRCTAEVAVPRLFPRSRAEVIYYPVPPSTIADRAGNRAAVRGELGAAGDAVAIVLAARLERWKGHTLLIEALARLRDRGGWEAWIVGGVQRPHERPYLDELQAAAAAAGIADRVKFLGQRSDVPRLMAAADIHCQPNTGPEPMGIAFVEALYAGLPVVSTRMGGAAEIVTDSCGILVEPDAPEALAAVLGGLIADPAARARLGAAGPARARELCDPSMVLRRTRDLLASLVGHEPE